MLGTENAETNCKKTKSKTGLGVTYSRYLSVGGLPQNAGGSQPAPQAYGPAALLFGGSTSGGVLRKALTSRYTNKVINKAA